VTLLFSRGRARHFFVSHSLPALPRVFGRFLMKEPRISPPFSSSCPRKFFPYQIACPLFDYMCLALLSYLSLRRFAFHFLCSTSDHLHLGMVSPMKHSAFVFLFCAHRARPVFHSLIFVREASTMPFQCHLALWIHCVGGSQTFGLFPRWTTARESSFSPSCVFCDTDDFFCEICAAAVEGNIPYMISICSRNPFRRVLRPPSHTCVAVTLSK